MKTDLSLTVRLYSLGNAGALRKVLESIPDDADIDVQVHSADRWGVDTYSLTFDWTVES